MDAIFSLHCIEIYNILFNDDFCVNDSRDVSQILFLPGTAILFRSCQDWLETSGDKFWHELRMLLFDLCFLLCNLFLLFFNFVFVNTAF